MKLCEFFLFVVFSDLTFLSESQVIVDNKNLLKIIGGYNAPVNSSPWMVSLRPVVKYSIGEFFILKINYINQ